MRRLYRFVKRMVCLFLCLSMVSGRVYALSTAQELQVDFVYGAAFRDVERGFLAQSEGHSNDWLCVHHEDRVVSVPEVPFRVSPFPVYLSLTQYHKIVDIGAALDEYYGQCVNLDELIDHATDPDRWRGYLDTYNLGMQEGENLLPYFLRPDLLVTDEGFSLVEVETSPFGLGLALVLDEIYRGNSTRKDVAVRAFLQRLFPNGGERDTELVFVFTHHTQRFMGQMKTFAGLLRDHGIDAHVVCVDEDGERERLRAQIARKGSSMLFYRCYYSREVESNANVATCVDDAFLSNVSIVPSLNSFYESKLPLALFHDSGVNRYLKEVLGDLHYDVLMSVIPKTWVLDNAAVPSWVGGGDEWGAVGALPKGKREYVLKPVLGSWARGVSFLHKVSGKKARTQIESALSSDELFIMQDMVPVKKEHVLYYDYESQTYRDMYGAMRITPYFFIHGDKPFTMKATVREKTLYIHGASDSVNVPVFVQDRFQGSAPRVKNATFRLFDLDGTLTEKNTPISDEVATKLIALLRRDLALVIGIESMQGWEELQNNVIDVIMKLDEAAVFDVLPRFFIFPNGSSSCYGWDGSDWRIMYDMAMAAGVDFKDVHTFLRDKGVDARYRGGALLGANLGDALRTLPTLWQDGLRVSRDGRHMTVRGVSKAVGARWLLARYGVSSRAITAYGDTVKFSVNGDQSMALNYGTFVPITSIAEMEEHLDALLATTDRPQSLDSELHEDMLRAA